MEFVCEKETVFRIVSPRMSIFSMRIFSTWNQLHNKHYIQYSESIYANNLEALDASQSEISFENQYPLFCIKGE